MSEHFRTCSTCKTPIPFEARYYKCSVSTCNRRATAMFFCSVPCWDAHVPEARHRDAWAEVEQAPTRKEWEAGKARQPRETSSTNTEANAARRRVVSSSTDPIAAGASASPGDSEDDLSKDALPRDVLVVMSKLKAYVKARSGLNTSDGVSEAISDSIRSLCDQAIRSARQNERKTVLARDFEAVLRGEKASH